MTRAHVTALALVNWKGVFYERYRLDRHVTALEGANGAGKTTVMIAAYVALLPDMSRLRFTNVGESGASGGDRGIWGRLGESGRPSYTALDILCGAQRIVAGVRLRRGSEPSVEATPFLIAGLPAELPLSELLLLRAGEQDAVAELDEIKSSVRHAGAQLEVFRSTKEYFAALFERGIAPLRLSTDEDRNKWNEMLRTSMTGGISRVLTSELRGFLLKQESGLGDVLGRMRANLDACRRTRTEVAEARVLERDISAVYEAGRAMFGYALHAVRSAAEESEASASAALATHATAARAAEQLELQLTEAAVREQSLEQRAEQARAQQHECAVRLERLRAADALARKCAALAPELERLAAASVKARTAQAEAADERAARRIERERMQEAQRAAVLGLAQLQSGLDELHRRAHAHRQLLSQLSEARTLLELPDLTLADAPGQLASVLAAREPQLAARARYERERDGANQRMADLERASGALATLEAALSPLAAAASGAALQRGRRVLAQLSELDAELQRLPGLELELVEATRLAARQAQLRTRAADSGVHSGPGALAALEERVLALEQLLPAALERRAQADTSVAEGTSERARLREHSQLLEQRFVRYQALSAAAQRAQAVLATPIASEADLAAARDRVADELLQCKLERQRTLEAREHDLRLAAELAGPGAALDPELLRIRDSLGAELLLERFDDLPPAAAPELEARLGARVHALVVEDLEAAAAQLIDRPRSLDTLWLVRAGSEPAPRLVRAGERDVLSEEAGGLRLCRLPEQSSLGAGARAARAGQLRESAGVHATQLEQLETRTRELVAIRRDLDQLASERASWLAGDPAPELESVSAELPRLEQAELELRAQLAALSTQTAELRATLDILRALIPNGSLLEPPEHAQRCDELALRVKQARAQRARLAPLGPVRATLSELLDVLRAAPEASGRQEVALRLAELDAELERGYRASAALEAALQNRHANAWHDAADALRAQTSLVPALEAQHEQGRLGVQAADAAVLAADDAWERATLLAQQADGAHTSLRAEHERLASELVELGGAPESLQLTAAEGDAQVALERVTGLSREARGSVSEIARLRERAEHAARRVAEALAAAQLEGQRAEPKRVAWQALKTAAQAAGLLADLAAASGESSPSAELFAQAESHAALLVERLGRSRGGEDTAKLIGAASGRGPKAMLEAWQLARDWLRRRVPLQVAEHAEPLLALERLRDHLDVLEGRLARQEADLRGASEDVARGIDVQLRRALGQVRRLNAQIQGVHFGSIAAIRVEMRRIDRMEQILRALREGDAQELLFLPSIPIEEALDEIFRRYGGGKAGGGKAGGARLLDYREYVELAVEVRRKSGEQWEPASPTRLSTGEAIGVGAALMMVVLTEWERDANLLRAERAFGSLRFLFLDEANRLSRDNLGVLFELCRNLDLQLLIAAPEVARAEGNTTYRLVRQVRDDGSEEVIVSGRRAISPEQSEVDVDTNPHPAVPS